MADVDLDMEWQGGMRFTARSGELVTTLDGDRAAGLSPVQALAAALGGCMAIDVVAILEKGRFDLQGLSLHVEGERAGDQPRRLVRVALDFEVRGDVPEDRVDRAVALSRDKYCSVWHSLQPDIAFETRFRIAAAS